MVIITLMIIHSNRRLRIGEDAFSASSDHPVVLYSLKPLEVDILQEGIRFRPWGITLILLGTGEKAHEVAGCFICYLAFINPQEDLAGTVPSWRNP